jgi:lauroyl/myristoyl acyltransferase
LNSDKSFSVIVSAIEGDAGDRLAYVMWRSRRRIAVENILRAGVSPTPAGARAAFRTLALMVVESAIVRRRMTAVRLRPFRYALQIVGAVTVERTGDRETDAAAPMQALTADIGPAVRPHPEQYMWGHRRWRTPRAATS